MCRWRVLELLTRFPHCRALHRPCGCEVARFRFNGLAFGISASKRLEPWSWAREKSARHPSRSAARTRAALPCARTSALPERAFLNFGSVSGSSIGGDGVLDGTLGVMHRIVTLRAQCARVSPDHAVVCWRRVRRARTAAAPPAATHRGRRVPRRNLRTAPWAGGDICAGPVSMLVEGCRAPRLRKVMAGAPSSGASDHAGVEGRQLSPGKRARQALAIVIAEDVREEHSPSSEFGSNRIRSELGTGSGTCPVRPACVT